MSAGGEAWSKSSRFKLLGGDLPATFHVATNRLKPNQKERSFHNQYNYKSIPFVRREEKEGREGYL